MYHSMELCFSFFLISFNNASYIVNNFFPLCYMYHQFKNFPKHVFVLHCIFNRFVYVYQIKITIQEKLSDADTCTIV